VLTQLRLALLALALTSGVWAGSASAQWPWRESGSTLARLEPGYGGVCEGCDLSGRILAGARMSNAVFTRSDFSDAVLSRANAERSRFEGADFSGADLREANVSGAIFTGADFDGADLTDANLQGAQIPGANLRTARGLTQAQLDEACGDAQTRVPRGLRVRRC
jgi:uncharacterized protein YjbI with pentapeptide repeats